MLIKNEFLGLKKLVLPTILLGFGALSASQETFNKMLLQAAQTGSAQEVHQALSAGANINVVSTDGWTPLHNAVSSGHIDVIELLLRNGARLDIANPIMLQMSNNKNQWTALRSLTHTWETNQQAAKEILSLFARERGPEALMEAAKVYRFYRHFIEELLTSGAKYPTDEQIQASNLTDAQKTQLINLIEADRSRLRRSADAVQIVISLNEQSIPKDVIFKQLHMVYGENIKDKTVKKVLESYIWMGELAEEVEGLE